MNPMVQQILQLLLIPILPTVAVLIIALLKKYINKIQLQINDDTINGYIDIAEDLAYKVVMELNQTTVDTLKQLQCGKLTEEQKLEIFCKAKGKLYTLLTKKQTEVLSQVYKDFDGYLQSLIETTVKEVKP